MRICGNMGVAEDRIFFTGNVMIDTLLKNRSRFRKPAIWEKLSLREKEYIVMPLHRPANVDEESKLKSLIREIIICSGELPLVFPMHPRTMKILKDLGINHPRLHMTDPMGYLEFNYLIERAKAVITDTEEITQEASILNIPCITLRDNTERPETIDLSTNELLGTDPAGDGKTIFRILEAGSRDPQMGRAGSGADRGCIGGMG